MERIERPRFQHFDFWLLGATLLLVVIGVLMIYSATACITGEALDWESPALRQAIYAVAGLVAMIVLTLIDYRIYSPLRWMIWVVTLALLAYCGCVGSGDARRATLDRFAHFPLSTFRAFKITFGRRRRQVHGGSRKRNDALAGSPLVVFVNRSCRLSWCICNRIWARRL